MCAFSDGTGENLDFGQSSSRRIAQMPAKDCSSARKGATVVSATKDENGGRTVITNMLKRNICCIKKAKTRHVPEIEIKPKITWKA